MQVSFWCYQDSLQAAVMTSMIDFASDLWPLVAGHSQQRHWQHRQIEAVQPSQPADHDLWPHLLRDPLHSKGLDRMEGASIRVQASHGIARCRVAAPSLPASMQQLARALAPGPCVLTEACFDVPVFHDDREQKDLAA